MRNKRLLLVFLPLLLCLWGFTPFTQVQNVCPKCPKPARFDVVVLTTSVNAPCKVVAQNADYYVLERYGELRPVLKSEVTSIEWKDKKAGAPNNLTIGDQILTKNNVVYHGSITGEQKGRYFEIQVGNLKHVVWYSQIQSVHRGGVVYPFSAAPPVPAK